jgi:hypothetical protein
MKDVLGKGMIEKRSNVRRIATSRQLPRLRKIQRQVDYINRDLILEHCNDTAINSTVAVEGKILYAKPVYMLPDGIL